jgi:DcaP outer membrane protein
MKFKDMRAKARNAMARGRVSALCLVSAVVGAGVVFPAAAADQANQERSFEIYGFAMLDGIQDTKRVDPNWMDAFRPSKIATPEGQFGTNGQSSISVKQSRFGVKGSMPTGDDTPPVTFKFEFDLFGVGVDAGQTTIRFRHVYGEWGQLLAGQTNSTWMDIDVFPNTIDYWGPSGMVFYRLPQIRWTPYRTKTSEFAIALEKPGNDVDAGNIRLIEEFQNATVRGDQTVPDLTSHYRMDGDWGHFQIGGILRRVGYEYQPNPNESFTKGSRTGWGVNLAGAINLFVRDDVKDKLLLQVVHGDGIATYMNDGGMDIAPTAFYNPLAPTPSLTSEAVPLTGVVAYYDHYWNSQWSSSIGYSFTQVSNTNFQASNAFHKGDYASVNLLWSGVKHVLIGGELLWGKRTDNDGVTGDDVRFQFSVKYDFGIKL